MERRPIAIDNPAPWWEMAIAIFIAIGVSCMRLATGASNIALALAVLLGLYAWWRHKWSFHWEDPIWQYMSICVLFFLILAFSAVDTANPEAVLMYWVKNWLGRFSLFVIIVTMVRRKLYLLRILYAYIVVFAVDCCTAAYQFFVLHWERGRGFHGDYLDLTAIICMVLAMSAIMLLDKHFDKTSKIFATIGLIGAFIGLFGAFGRGAFLVSAIVAPVYLVFYVRVNVIKAVSIMATLCVLGSLLYYSPMYHERLSTTFNTTTNRSNVDRMWAWQSSLDMFRDYPINGVGISQWKTNYDHGYKYEEELQNLPHAHSNYMQLLAETGMVGMVGMFIWYVATLVLPFKRWYEQRNPWDLIIVSVFLAWALFGVFQPTYSLSAVVRSLWAILAIAMQMRFMKDNSVSQEG